MTLSAKSRSGLGYFCPECQNSLKAQPHEGPPGFYDCPICNITWQITNLTNIPQNILEKMASHYLKNPLPEETKEAFRSFIK